MIFKKACIAALIGLFGFCLGLPLRVAAFGVSPPIIEATIEPGAQLVGSMMVKNDEDGIQDFAFSIQKFIPSGTDGRQTFLPPTDKLGLPQWVDVEAPTLQLLPGTKRELKYVIHPPKDAQPGGYYAALFVSARPPGVKQESVFTGARTGILMLITIPGQVIENASITSLDGETAFDLPAQFKIAVKNEGTNHITPVGEIRISNVFGTEVARIPFNPDLGRLLPSSTRIYSADWTRDSTSTGSFVSNLAQEWSPFLLGPYQASINILEPTSTRVEVAPVGIVILPWRTLLIMSLVLVLILGISMRGRRI